MSNNICSIPVSIGELFDKYTILLIKKEKIHDINKLKFVINEINYLEPIIKQFNLEYNILEELLRCNTELWNIEDSIRLKEREYIFDDSFIQLARLVYIKNDNRSEIKKRINNIFNSDIYEVKSYN
jgi:hypothetical protein